jgi:hypothetical protein
MSDNKGSFKRKMTIVYPKLQSSLIIVNVLQTLVVISIFCGSYFYSFSNFQVLGERVGFSPTHPYFKFLDYYEGKLFGMILLGSLFMLLLSFLFNLVYSHKIAGPIYRLKTYFNEVKEKGEHYPLKFREGDYTEDLGPLITEVLDMVAGKKNSSGSSEKNNDENS